MSYQHERYRATFYHDNCQKELLHIGDADEAGIISRSVAILEENYHDAYCVIEDERTDKKVLTLKRCGIE